MVCMIHGSEQPKLDSSEEAKKIFNQRCGSLKNLMRSAKFWKALSDDNKFTGIALMPIGGFWGLETKQ